MLATPLAERLCSLSSTEFNDQLVDLIRRRVFDTLGALVAGWQLSEVGRVADAPGWGDDGALARTRRLCAAARASEVDDIHAPSCTTAGSVAVPVSLALAAESGADDRRVLRAVVAGYEAMIWFGQAINGSEVIYRGIWASYAAAPVGAAASAAVLLGLDVAQTEHALNIAAMRIAGTNARSSGPSPRWLMFGAAAADGLLAAVAAGRGLTSTADVFDRALPSALRADFDGTAIEPDGERRWAICAVDQKPYCTARQALSAIEAVRGAAAKLGEDPAEITIGLPSQVRKMVDNPQATRRQTVGSVQVQSALALVDPDRLYDVERTVFVPDGRVSRLVGAMSVYEEPSLSARYPGLWGGTATVRAASGKSATVTLFDPPGSASRPFGWTESLAKWRAILGSMPSLDPLAEACQAVTDTRHASTAASLLRLAEGMRLRRSA